MSPHGLATRDLPSVGARSTTPEAFRERLVPWEQRRISWGSTGRPSVCSSGLRPSVRVSAFNVDTRPQPRWLVRCRRFAAHILRHNAVQVILATSLIFALCGDSLWVLLNIPDKSGTVVLDTLMSLATIVFIVEIILNFLENHRQYPFSVFFLADALGCLSMIFEVSFLLGLSGKIQTGGGTAENVKRVVRAAKVGPRVGRLSKLFKCVAFVYRDRRPIHGRHHHHHHRHHQAEAKVLSARLMRALSTKVSLLTIVLVLIMPLFSIGQYPVEDLSMQSWVNRLEDEYRRAYDDLQALPGNLNATLRFAGTVDRFAGFYGDTNYRPFKWEGFTSQVLIGGVPTAVGGAANVHGPEPAQRRHIYRKEVGECLVLRAGCNGTEKAALYWDFQAANQFQAAMNLSMIAFIVLVMVLTSWDLSRTIKRIVVVPMERMLGLVRGLASDILRQLGGEGEEEGDEGQEETEVLEGIFRKFARLAAIATERNTPSDEELANMDDAGKGVIMDIMQAGATRQCRLSAASSLPFGAVSTDGNDAAGTLPVSLDVVESWELDVLGLDTEGLRQVVLYVFFDSSVGHASARPRVQVEKFQFFLGTVRAGYHDLPYHCYAHACDVLHAVFRLLTETMSERWLSDIERYAILVAALCHDLGHQGKTNPFLVEMKHELALRYNDRSPLENMHCATLFEICSREETDIFDRLSPEQQREARKVCIAAILHTDNANHFEMVREINKVYELASAVCETQASYPKELLSAYQEQVLEKNRLLWLELFLHFSDVSNPLKPFDICKSWAWRVLDEFFAQGDEERELGLPVGMLNNRERVNRPGSQHGFITFLVSPLVTATVRLFPGLHPLSSQMADNLEAWRDLWVQDAKPPPEEVAKRDAEVLKVRETAKRLRARS